MTDKEAAEYIYKNLNRGKLAVQFLMMCAMVAKQGRPVSIAYLLALAVIAQHMDADKPTKEDHQVAAIVAEMVMTELENGIARAEEWIGAGIEPADPELEKRRTN